MSARPAGHQHVRIGSAHYDRNLPRCQVCHARVDTRPGQLAEDHGRIGPAVGGVARAEFCPGSGQPVLSPGRN